MADAGEADLIFNIAVAAAVQDKMADKAQQIGQLTFPEKFPFPCRTRLRALLKKSAAGSPCMRYPRSFTGLEDRAL